MTEPPEGAPVSGDASADRPVKDQADVQKPTADSPAVEHGGRPGPDPTRYGDWEKNGRCIDF